MPSAFPKVTLGVLILVFTGTNSPKVGTVPVLLTFVLPEQSAAPERMHE